MLVHPEFPIGCSGSDRTVHFVHHKDRRELAAGRSGDGTSKLVNRLAAFSRQRETLLGRTYPFATRYRIPPQNLRGRWTICR